MGNLRILGVIVILVTLLGIFAAVKGFISSSNPDELSQEEIGGEALRGTGTYELVTAESEVRWAGHKRLIPGYTDRGLIPLKSGSLTVDDGTITSGAIVFDIAGIHATSTSIAKPEGLTRHLRSGDFFLVEEFPEARLEILRVTENGDADVMMVGNLTIKDQTQEIEFPADVRLQSDGRLLAKGEFSLDRTRWGITYGSGSFFQDLGDQVIANEVDISFTATFTPSTSTE